MVKGEGLAWKRDRGTSALGGLALMRLKSSHSVFGVSFTSTALEEMTTTFNFNRMYWVKRA